MYFCGGTIAGPFYEYKDYKNFMEKKEHYSSIPSTFIPTLIRLSHAGSILCDNSSIVILCVLMLTEGYFSNSYLMLPEFAEKPFFFKVFSSVLIF